MNESWATPSPEHLPSLQESMDRPTMERMIADFVIELLRNDFGRLCQLLYKHDVDERKFNEALQLPDDEERAMQIARLVVDRELQKIKTRAAYAAQKSKPTPETDHGI